ncbi:MAG: hypothetical protein HQL32_03020 [Planctomycetes bacterium]|nr:hypothetical protein [Planctomycetota bacterium]
MMKTVSTPLAFARLAIASFLALSMSLFASAEQINARPGEDLQAILDAGHDLILAPSELYPIKRALNFTKPGQRISTGGASRISEYATLRVEGRNNSQLISGSHVSDIIIEKLILDGNKYSGPTGNKMAVYRPPLVFLGGDGAKRQVIRHCVLMNSKTWSTLKVHEGGEDILVERNLILAAGSDARGNGVSAGETPFAWGDGISCAATRTTIHHNIILDPTDVGIVLFGAPGSDVKGNVIATISRESLGGINLVDPLYYYKIEDKEETEEAGESEVAEEAGETEVAEEAGESEVAEEAEESEVDEEAEIAELDRFNYNGLNIHHNTIDCFGARIHIAVPMGCGPWAPGKKDNILVGASLSYNHISGGAGGYGFVAHNIDQFTLKHNTSSASYSGRGDGISNQLPEDPGPFYYTKGSTGSSLLQPEFKESKRHLLHLLRCNHGPTNERGFRNYAYGEQEVVAVVEAAYNEILGVTPNKYQLTEMVRWLEKEKVNADSVRQKLLASESFRNRVGNIPSEDMHRYRTSLWLSLFDHVISTNITKFSAKEAYHGAKESLINPTIRNATIAPTLKLLNSYKETAKPVMVDTSTLDGKVICGYQGWYRTPTDGSGLGWEHYETYDEDFHPGECGIDYWPATDEMDEDEKYVTKFKHHDETPAVVFSSQNPKTVNRHFKWMAQYGIDGVFLQRFAIDVVGYHHQSDLLLPSNNEILKNVQMGAQAHGRSFAIMYDLTGMPKNDMQKVMDDWKMLVDRFDLLNDSAYQGHKGKPVVALWGVGFDDGRKYTLEDVDGLMDFLKNDPKYGGCSVVLGIPTYWRKMERDSVKDPAFHELLKKADFILPWSIGRFGGSAAAKRHSKEIFAPDFKWCEENGVGYMPTAFPGFSWANRYEAKKAKFNHIPREGGLFLWNQCLGAAKAGAQTVYIAMFDEMDEGTQIFKVEQNIPAGESHFLSYDPLPSDFYLRLTGKVGEMLRGDIPMTDDLPDILD